jgi:hypothetical protein
VALPGALRTRVTGVVLIVLAAAAVVVAAERRGHRSKSKPVAHASGAISSNSRDGQAILTASELGPGDSVSGQVRISNAGDGPGEFTLTQRLRSETAGLGGGRLFDRLSLLVRRLDGAGELVYSGPLSAMTQSGVGTIESGEARDYEFVVSFPHGSADDAAQSSSVSVDYEWTAADAARRQGCRFGMVGSRGPDAIDGGRRDDVIRGRAGNDLIRGFGGPDCLLGGHGDDLIRAGRGDDRARGSYGDDEVLGGSGDDVLRGRQGDDLIVGGSGSDRLRGTSGEDVIDSRDGELDRVRCGIGYDEAVVDPIDIVRGCELLR